MPRAHQAISGASFDPDDVKLLCNLWDEVWSSLSEDFGSGEDAEFARLQLATTIIDLARDQQLEALQIARTAARLMRERSVQTAKQTRR